MDARIKSGHDEWFVWRARATKEVVILRESGGSSTPRPVDSIAGVPAYWVARSSRAMTAEIEFEQPKPSLRGALATKQSTLASLLAARWIASLTLAMTFRALEIEP
jgi:hypothetical protein